MNNDLIGRVFERFKVELGLGYKVIGAMPEKTKYKFSIIDDEGYLYFNSYSGLLKNIKRGSKMDFVSCLNPYAIYNIRLWLFYNLPQITLISEEFEKAKNKLNFKCNICGEFESTWDDISHGAGCPKCNYNKKYELEDVHRYLKNLSDVVGIEYYLLDGEYIASQSKSLTILDEYGYKYLCSLSYIIKCANNGYKIPIFDNCFVNENINNYIIVNKLPYIRLTNEYDNVFSKMKFLCDKHKNEFEASLYQLRHTIPCKECSRELITGENSQNWKGGITPLSEYLRKVIGTWKDDTRRICENKCDITGKETKLVHHLYSFSFIVEEVLKALDMDMRDNMSYYSKEEMDMMRKKCLELHYKHGLGICLTEYVHKEFHSIYGYGNNTPEQYYEFKNNKLNDKESEIA